MSVKSETSNRSGRQSAEVAAQTRIQILDAALSCFAHQGFTSTSLRDIAEQADITHGLPRHHFGSKEELWKACAMHVLSRLEDRQVPVLEEITPETALPAFKAVVRSFIIGAAEYPDFWRLVAFEALKDGERLHYVAELAMPQHQRIAGLFAMVQEQGHFPGLTNDDFFLFVLSLGAMPFALAPLTNMLYGKDILDDGNRDRHVDLVMGFLFRD